MPKGYDWFLSLQREQSSSDICKKGDVDEKT